MPPSNRMRSASPRPHRFQNWANTSLERSRSSSRDDTSSLYKQWQDINSKNSHWQAKSRSLSPMPKRNQTPRLLNSYLEQFSSNQIRKEGFADIFDTSKQQLDHHTTNTNKLPKPFKSAMKWAELSNEGMIHGANNRLVDEECSKSERIRQAAAPRSTSPMRRSTSPRPKHSPANQPTSQPISERSINQTSQVANQTTNQKRSVYVDNGREIGTARGISKACKEPPWATDKLPGGGYDHVPKAIPMKAMGCPSAFVATASKQHTSCNAKNQLSEGWFGWSSDTISPRKMNAPHCKAQWRDNARKYDNEMIKVGSWSRTLRR